MKRLYGRLPWRAAALSTAAAAAFGLAIAPAGADEKADVILARTRAAYKTANSLTTNLSVTTTQGAQKFTQTGSIQLRKPNLARMEMTAPQKMSLMSDGTSVYILMPDNQYMKQPAQGGLSQAEMMGGFPISLFFGHDTFGFGKLSAADTTTKYAGKVTTAGVVYDVVTVTGKTPYVFKADLFIGPDGLVSRSTADVTVQGQKITQASEWKGQKINAVPATASFAVVLPKGAKPFTAPAAQDYAAKLVAVGKPAPVFSVPTPTGGTVSLADSTADHKAVLVNFWFYN